MLGYTIYAADNDPQGKYMWSLNCDTARSRVWSADAPEMIADVYRDNTAAGGYFLHAFSLLKKSNPKISEAKRKRETVAIMGKDGNDDLLEGYLGYPVYDRRTFTETFILLRDGSDEHHIAPADHDEWAALGSEVANYLNSHIGQMRIAPSDDPGFYWKGRATATWEPDGHRAILTVTADVEPYKLEMYHSAEPWLWDNFSFIDGIIREYGNIAVPAGETVLLTVPVRNMDMVPEFKIVSGTVAGYSFYVSLMDGSTEKKRGYINSADFDKIDDALATYAEWFTIPGDWTGNRTQTLRFANTTAGAVTVAVKVRGGSL